MVTIEIPITSITTQVSSYKGVWAVDLTGAYSWLDPDFITGWTDTRKTQISSVKAGATFLPRYEEIEEITESIPGGFCTEETTVYFRLSNNADPNLYDICLGIPVFVSDDSFQGAGVIYNPGLLTNPKIKRAKDFLEFGRFSFASQTITVENSDGAYDSLTGETVFGQTVSIYYGADPRKKIYSGKIKTYELTDSTFKISTADSRQLLEKKLPEKRFSDLGHTFDGDNGYAPIVYGKVFNYILAHTGSGVFVIADTTSTAIKTQAEADITVTAINATGGREAVATGSLALDEANGTLTITGYAEDGSSTYTGEVRYTGHGVDINKASDIVKDLLVTYSGYLYTGAHFDTAAWESEESAIPDIGIVIKNRKKIIQLIEEIMGALQYGFIVNPDGLFTIRRFATGKAAVGIISRASWVEPLTLSEDTENVVTSVDVTYKNDEHYINAAFEEEVSGRYNLFRSKEIKTALIDSASAKELGDDYIVQYKVAPKYINGAIELATDNITWEQGQTVVAEISQRRGEGYTDLLGWQRCEIITAVLDTKKDILSLELRPFQKISAGSGVLCPGAATATEGFLAGVSLCDSIS